MSLTLWSLLYFGSLSFYYLVMFISLFTKLTIGKILLTGIAFMTQCAVILAYGITTNQIGLVFIGVLQIIMVILMFIQYERLSNENN